MRDAAFVPTLVGALAVIIWGLSLPVDRILETDFGVPATIGIVFTAIGLFGILKQILQKQSRPEKAVFRNPYFYARWIFFVMHEAFIMTAILIVQKSYVPFVILLNYLWPTAIIVCSIMFAGIRITRYVPFFAGTVVVIVALSIEILSKDILSLNLFDQASDCLAYLLAVVSALAWGMYNALSRRTGHETGSGDVIPYFQLTLGLALPLSFIPGWGAWDHMTWAMAGFLVFWCLLQFFAYLVWDYGMRLGSVVVLSLFADFIPWFSLAASHFLVGVDIGFKTVLSALCLVTGAMIARYGTLEKKRRLEPELAAMLSSHPPSD